MTFVFLPEPRSPPPSPSPPPQSPPPLSRQPPSESREPDPACLSVLCLTRCWGPRPRCARRRRALSCRIMSAMLYRLVRPCAGDADPISTSICKYNTSTRKCKHPQCKHNANICPANANPGVFDVLNTFFLLPISPMIKLACLQVTRSVIVLVASGSSVFPVADACCIFLPHYSGRCCNLPLSCNL